MNAEFSQFSFQINHAWLYIDEWAYNNFGLWEIKITLPNKTFVFQK